MISSTSSSPLLQQLTWAVNLTQNKIIFLNQEVESIKLDQLTPSKNNAQQFLDTLNFGKNILDNNTNTTQLKTVVVIANLKIISQAHITKIEDQSVVFGTSNLFDSNHLHQHSKSLFQETADLKSKFLNNITHEFKAPITRIQGLSEIIRLQFPNPELDEYIRLIQLCADKLKFSAESILEFSKWNHQNNQTPFTKVCVFKLIQALINELKIQSHKRNIELVLSQSTNKTESSTSPGILQEALKLILMTAIENSKNGKVEIDITQASSRLCVNIIDSGKGIPNDLIVEIAADATVQTKKERKNSRQKQRSGILLSIAADYLNELGGTLKAKKLNAYQNQFSACIPVNSN